jgi:unsaturated rhamnogalacturonyl hydrolase
MACLPAKNTWSGTPIAALAAFSEREQWVGGRRMKEITRREAVTHGLCFSIAAGAGRGAPWLDGHNEASAKPIPVDWSEGVIATTMGRTPAAPDLGSWGYAISLYLYGQYLVYKRTGARRYFTYMQQWVDSHVSGNGVIDSNIDALDYMLPGNLLLVLYKETGEPKYKTAAESIRIRLNSYPRTQDGGFWHALSRQHQLWLDGMFMSMPFLVRYGSAFNDERYACDEAVKQLLIYARHLNDPASGLMYHAYDESGAQPWAQPTTHHSSFFWCRAIGWYGMALIEVLEVLPHDHSRRNELIGLVRQLAGSYKTYQDNATGLWYQVVDKGAVSGNWLETSSSCMYVYTLDRAMDRGYISRRYASVARKGYHGVISKVFVGSDGSAHITNICEGTNVGDLDYYLARGRETDDFHGLGAFLIMNEQVRGKYA